MMKIDSLSRFAVVPMRGRCAVFLLLVAPFCVSTGRCETLGEAVAKAVANSPLVKVAGAQRRGSEANVELAKAAFSPTLDLDLSAGARTSGATSQERPTLRERGAGLALAHTLADGGARAAELRQQRARAASFSAKEREARERVAMSTVEAYAGHLTAHAMLQLANQNYAAHQAVVEKMSALVQTDPGRRFELRQAQARLALAAVVLTARKVRLRESELQYEQVVGALPAGPADFAKPRLEPDLESAVRRALSNNAGMAIADAEIRAAREGLAATRAASKPRLHLEITSRASTDAFGEAGGRRDSAVLLGMRWNLFDGGASRARAAAAMEEVNALVGTADNTRRVVRENVSVAWNAMAGHAASNRDLEAQVQYASDTLAAYQDQFRIGRRSVLDVLNAESELFTARSNLVAGKYSEKVAAFQVLAAQGDILRAVAGGAGAAAADGGK